MMIPPLNVIAAMLLASAASGFIGGWQINSWRHAAALSAEREANQRAINAASQRESAISAQLEKRLADLHANQTVIDRGVIREIQKPVYRTVCIQPDGVRILNAAASGATDTTAESAGEMPGNPPAPP